MSKDKANQRAEQLLEAFDLTQQCDKYPNEMSGMQVLDLLTQLNEEGQSIVMVTHDIKACVRGNRLLFLADGRVNGDLNLGRYNPSEQQAREEMVFQFLKKHQW